MSPNDLAIDRNEQPFNLLSEQAQADYEAFNRLPEWTRRRALVGAGRRRFLYKYLDFDPKQNLSYKKARDFIVESKMFLANPAALNDPFDFCAHWSVSGQEAFNTWSEIAARSLIEKGDTRSSSELQAIARNRLAREPDYINDTFAVSVRRHGVACFASNAKSIRMWSHYAASHSGICLQFNVARSVDRLALALPVEYVPAFPKLFFPEDVSNVINKVLTVKSELWLEEGEYRYIDGRPGGRLVTFNPVALSSIILGARFGGESVKKLRRLLEQRERLGHPPVNLYRAHVSKTAYELRITATELA